MLKEDLNHRLEECNTKCFVCKKEFVKGDEIRDVFDKAFGKTVRVHKSHYFFVEE